MKRLLYAVLLVALFLTSGCGGGGDGLDHSCFNAVQTMRNYTSNNAEQLMGQARGAMDSFCFVEDCIAMMNYTVTEEVLLPLIDQIEQHCPCRKSINPSVPIGDYRKFRDWCGEYESREYSQPAPPAS